MKHITLFMLFFFWCLPNAHALVKYNPSDMKRFTETNNCPGCNLSGAYTWVDVNHQGANLINANVSDAYFLGDYTQTDFTNIDGTDVHIYHASEAKFINAILIQGNFSGGNFTSADFTYANVKDANFSHANLYGAKISWEQLATARSVCEAILPDGSKGSCNT